MKKIKLIVLSLLLLLGYSSCSNEKYSFSEVVGRQISEIEKVKYVTTDLSFAHDYQGDYKKFIDVKYSKVKEETALQTYNTIVNNFTFLFSFEYKDTTDTNTIYFYQNKLYLSGKTNELFCTVKKVNLEDILNSKVENNNNSSSISDNSKHTFSMTAKFDYGDIIDGKVYLLLGSIEIFFNPDNYNFPTIVAGDCVVMTYIGDSNIYILTSYPARIVLEDMEIITFELYEAEIIEFEVSQDNEGNIILITDDERYQDDFEVTTQYVVHQDLSFEDYKNLEIGSKVYGVNPFSSDGLEIATLYSYYPRIKK